MLGWAGRWMWLSAGCCRAAPLLLRTAAAHRCCSPCLLTLRACLLVPLTHPPVQDVLGQCGHYSERVRRDALQGLAELLAAHPAELRRHTTLVVETAAERIGDGDASVRAALRELLAGTLLPALGGSALAPFVPLLMAHVCAAMTHLAEPIR